MGLRGILPALGRAINKEAVVYPRSLANMFPMGKRNRHPDRKKVGHPAENIRIKLPKP